jgi:Raf kinase inhibitor-like YbhB/YbcL family protein
VVKKNINIIIILLSITILFIVYISMNLNKNNTKQQISEINLISNAFLNNQTIPQKYGCSGENINPPLSITGIPKEAKSLALIVDDPDALSGDWVHWLLWNVNAEINKIEENSVPDGSVEGLNDFKNNKYDGPCPPFGSHRYFFKLYALDTILNLNKNSNKKDLENAMGGHILGQTELVGLYSK